MKKNSSIFILFIFLLMFCTACDNKTISQSSTSENILFQESSELNEIRTSEKEEKDSEASIKTGWITEQILEGNDGEIHYSYYLPENYDVNQAYPMIVIMPGYDMMWFGEESSGANLSWSGLLAWTNLSEDMIVVSAPLTD